MREKESNGGSKERQAEIRKESPSHLTTRQEERRKKGKTKGSRTDLSLELVGMMTKQSRPRISCRMRMKTSPSAKLEGEREEEWDEREGKREWRLRDPPKTEGGRV